MVGARASFAATESAKERHRYAKDGLGVLACLQVNSSKSPRLDFLTSRLVVIRPRLSSASRILALRELFYPFNSLMH